MALTVLGLCPLIQVFDMPSSLEFYCELLGFDVVSSAPGPERIAWALLRMGDTELMVNTAYEEGERPAAPDPLRVAAHGDMTIYFACPDVDGTARELQAKGLQVKGPVVQWYGMKQVTITDPDGFVLCFQWRVGTESDS